MGEATKRPDAPAPAPAAAPAPAGAPALEARGLACGYGGRAVLSDVSFTLDAGEVLVLLGPNGVGKTTLFKTVLGLLDPLAGEVRIQGRDLREWSENELARQLAYIPQMHESAFAFTVEQVVLMGRTPYVSGFSSPGAQDEEVACEAMERMGISDLAQRDYTELSGGERQMVLIARALAQQPRVLVMDEPCASLDLGNQSLLLTQVARLAREGMAVIMTTHDPNHAFALDGRVLCLGEGGLAAAGRASEVLTSDLMRRMYGVPVAVGRVPFGAGGQSAVACVPIVEGVAGEGEDHVE